MLAMNAASRCFVCLEPQDFRRGIDSLAGQVRQAMGKDPMNGAFYFFRNRSQTSIKVLFYGGIGFWLCQLRLSAGRLKWWPPSHGDPVSIDCVLSVREIQVMLSNGDPTWAQFIPEWKIIQKS